MLAAAEAQYRLQQRITAAAVLTARRSWGQLDLANLDASWRPLSARLTAVVSALQTSTARSATGYVSAALAEQGVTAPAAARLSPAGFAGLAGDGRDVSGLLYEPLIATKVAIGQGSSPEQAAAYGGSRLAMMVQTVIQDTARGSISTAITARPHVTGYIRMLNPPSCSRCAVLAGKWYRWSAGFRRHPRCDCVHVPALEDAAGDLRTDPLEAIRAGQVTGLSIADTKAILEDGANVSQVINAHRGMSTAQVYGQKLKITSEGITRHGIAGKRILERAEARANKPEFRHARSVRPMPESLYEIATDRADALRLLQLYGYIL